MKTLLIIPSVLKKGIESAVARDSHPSMDYYELTASLRSDTGSQADILDYAAIDKERNLLVRLARRSLGRDAALAILGFLRRKNYDTIFTNGENVGIPLGMLLKFTFRRPGHVTIGHKLSTGKKSLFFRVFRVDRQMDTIFVYASAQRDHATRNLRIPGNKVALIPFHADEVFYRPLNHVEVNESQICSAGLEWRDYPTLIAAVTEMPELTVKLAAASPWSKHTNETANRILPANVDTRRYEYSELRDLYATSSFVVVPLYETDFQAGVTTLLEAMAMGKAVIVTRTTGQTDVVVHGENGLTVEPGDVKGLQAAIKLLLTNQLLRTHLGESGRLWVEKNARLSRWVAHITGALTASTRSVESKTLASRPTHS